MDELVVKDAKYWEEALSAWKHRMRHGWGDWSLDIKNMALVYIFENIEYDIPLDRCNSSAQILDWIYQVYGKSWANPKVVCDLLKAFNDIAPVQQTFCSFGVERAKREDFKMIERVTILNKGLLLEE